MKKLTIEQLDKLEAKFKEDNYLLFKKLVKYINQDEGRSKVSVALKLARGAGYMVTMEHFNCVFLITLKDLKTSETGYIAHSHDLGDWTNGTNKKDVLARLETEE